VISTMVNFLERGKGVGKAPQRSAAHSANPHAYAVRLTPLILKGREWAMRQKLLAQGLCTIANNPGESLFWNGQCFTRI